MEIRMRISARPFSARAAEEAARSEQELVRREKVARMQAEGRDPYALGYARTTDITTLRAQYPALEPDTFTGEVVGIAGRVVLNRVSGKIIFATLRCPLVSSRGSTPSISESATSGTAPAFARRWATAIASRKRSTS